eukprot:scaffold115990_cov16-Tisochrysis_lutea.AAC.1
MLPYKQLQERLLPFRALTATRAFNRQGHTWCKGVCLLPAHHPCAGGVPTVPGDYDCDPSEDCRGASRGQEQVLA